MNITSVSPYSYTSFTGKPPVRKTGRFEKPSVQRTPGKPVTTKDKAVIAIAGGAAALALITGVAKEANKPQDMQASTTPTSSYSETVGDWETEPIEETIAQATLPTVQKPRITQIITARPQSERNAVWYEVKRGDRLADIVKKYAEIDALTPDKELEPYYLILEDDNPGAWGDRNRILIGTRFRVDGLFPKNRIEEFIDTTQTTQPTESIPATEETDPTDPTQVTSNEDTVVINGMEFSFDVGTTKKTMFGDYSGLMYGKYVTLDKKMGGKLVMTQYEGTNYKSNVESITTYDKDGNITQIDEYKDNQIVKSTTFYIRK